VRTLLITGHTGFVGRAMRRLIQEEEATFRRRIVTLPETFDIGSPSLAEQIADLKPDDVVHLAALTSVHDSFRDPERYFDVNFGGTWNVLKALRSASFNGRLLFVGSGDCYGTVPADELPVVETHPLRPRSPYAVSKVAAEALCLQWSQTEALDIVLTRSFNHIGPGQDERFAMASFAKQVAAIRDHGAPPRIATGDLDVTRDLTDVRDVVRAYLSLLDKGRTGEVYNVGSGRERRLSDVLGEMVQLAGVTAEIVIDPARMRASEQRRVVADVHKIAADTGWEASIPLSTTLTDMVDDWSGRIET
jgi:GDP-4-dehydro-6-deoxy-D-mannose reductase